MTQSRWCHSTQSYANQHRKNPFSVRNLMNVWITIISRCACSGQTNPITKDNHPIPIHNIFFLATYLFFARFLLLNAHNNGFQSMTIFIFFYRKSLRVFVWIKINFHRTAQYNANCRNKQQSRFVWQEKAWKYEIYSNVQSFWIWHFEHQSEAQMEIYIHSVSILIHLHRDTMSSLPLCLVFFPTKWINRIWIAFA
jgi:hypothetical protein